MIKRHFRELMVQVRATLLLDEGHVCIAYASRIATMLASEAAGNGDDQMAMLPEVLS